MESNELIKYSVDIQDSLTSAIFYELKRSQHLTYSNKRYKEGVLDGLYIALNVLNVHDYLQHYKP